MKFIIQLFLELALIFLLVLKIFVHNDCTPLFVFCLLLVFLIITVLLKTSRVIKSRREKDADFLVFTFSLLLVIGLYLVGFKTGYYQNYSVMYKSYIEKSTWIFTILCILVSEFIRYKVCSVEYKKVGKAIILMLLTVIFVLVDVGITTKTYSLTEFKDSFLFFALILLPSITKNIMLNYTCGEYGYKPCLVYRVIMDLYIFIIPVTPKLNEFIEASIYLIYPYFMYTMLFRLENPEEMEPARQKKHNYLPDIFIYSFSVIFVMLISREFTYSMIAIGSNSMVGEFSKGDAIIYKRYKNQNLKKGDIIVFTKEGRTIVHRINDLYTLYGDDVIITKGDANNDVDNWVVEKKEILGVLECRIKYIGWPTVLVSTKYKKE